jgi:hypothetical protein
VSCWCYNKKVLHQLKRYKSNEKLRIVWISYLLLVCLSCNSQNDNKLLSEDGDDIHSFIQQFDISLESAVKIFEMNGLKSSGNDELAKSISSLDRIDGAVFLRYNLSKSDGGWFSLNYWSAETQQQTINHVKFALEFASENGLKSIDFNKVLNFSSEDIAGSFGDGGITFKGYFEGTDGLPTVNGNPNPNSNGKTLTGVLFHMGNNYQTSQFDSDKIPYSDGCQTSGCFKDSRPTHNAFMNKVGRDFNGSYYLRSKPALIMPTIVPFSLDIQ